MVNTASIMQDMYQVFLLGFGTGLGICGICVLIGYTVRHLAAIFHK